MRKEEERGHYTVKGLEDITIKYNVRTLSCLHPDLSKPTLKSHLWRQPRKSEYGWKLEGIKELLFILKV